MKAIEYYEKYKELIFNDPRKEGVNLYIEFINELEETCKKRNIKTTRALCSVIKEFNTKWNCLADMFKKKSIDILKPNGFVIMMVNGVFRNHELDLYFPDFVEKEKSNERD